MISHTFLTTANWILPAHKPRSFPPFLPCPASHFRQGGLREYLPSCAPRLRGCQSQNHSHQSPQVRSYFMLSRFTTSSFRAARPQPLALLQIANLNLLAKIPMSISSPKCQCQPQAKLPISIPSPKCTTHEPLTPSPFCRPRADLINSRSLRKIRT